MRDGVLLSAPTGSAERRDAMTIRCKFVCSQKAENIDGTTNATFSAVMNGSPENKQFFKYTPNGTLSFGCANKDASKNIVVGREYYVDLTEVYEATE